MSEKFSAFDGSIKKVATAYQRRTQKFLTELLKGTRKCYPQGLNPFLHTFLKYYED